MLAALDSAGCVVLGTHMNADGDGAGSEVAMASFLARRGARAVIVNPTPWPNSYAFLLEGEEPVEVTEPESAEGRWALGEADLFLILDTSEAGRLGGVYDAMRGRAIAVLDHHPENPDPLGDPAVRDPSACATGELVLDLFDVAGEAPNRREAEAIYVAVATDTGSFRFSNTTPRTHRMAARLLEAGVDPEAMYRRLYARYTPARLHLLREALGSLQVDSELPIAWISLTLAQVHRSGADREAMEGVVEYARRLEGMEVALLIREIGGGRVKVSLRSNGPVNVAELARGLGGGGHEKAAGAVLDGSLAAATERILASVRPAVREVASG